MHSYGTSTSPTSHCNCMEHLRTSEEIWDFLLEDLIKFL
ncbi:hypothetical protein Nmel_011861 [Mimus melanotis]